MWSWAIWREFFHLVGFPLDDAIAVAAVTHPEFFEMTEPLFVDVALHERLVQLLHVALPSRTAKLPGLHERQSPGRLLPGMADARPGGQLTQEELLFDPRMGLKRPDGPASTTAEGHD